MAIVYQHKRIDTGEVFYVGIAELAKRPYDKRSRSKFWKDYTNKHPYVVEILEEGIEWERACLLERDLIKKHGRRDLGTGTLVNMTEGGEGRLGERQEEQKAKHRGWKHTPEALVKIKQARNARTMPPKTEAQKQHMSQKMKGYKRGLRSKEHIEKIASKKRGVKLGPRPDVVKQAISEGRKGLVYPKKECPYCSKMVAINGTNFKRHVQACTLNS